MPLSALLQVDLIDEDEFILLEDADDRNLSRWWRLVQLAKRANCRGCVLKADDRPYTAQGLALLARKRDTAEAWEAFLGLCCELGLLVVDQKTGAYRIVHWSRWHQPPAWSREASSERKSRQREREKAESQPQPEPEPEAEPPQFRRHTAPFDEQQNRFLDVIRKVYRTYMPSSFDGEQLQRAWLDLKQRKSRWNAPYSEDDFLEGIRLATEHARLAEQNGEQIRMLVTWIVKVASTKYFERVHEHRNLNEKQIARGLAPLAPLEPSFRKKAK
jgi:hypothetical protein